MTHLWQRLALLLALVIVSAPARAQIIGPPTVISVQDSGTVCSNAGTCATFTPAGGSPSFVIGVTGSGSGTLTFQIQADGSNWTTVQVTKLSDGTHVTTTTATGNFGLTNPGLTGIRVVGTALASGSFTVTLTAGTASASAASAGGGAQITGGTCTNQAVTAVSTAGTPTCTTLTSAYVTNSIALTGTDINTSNQVTATHLAAALPFAQGGTAATAQAALTHHQPANPTARSSSGAFVMMGLGAAASPCTITPVATGRVVFTISGQLDNNTAASTLTAKLAEGTGTAPANNDAATGTVISQNIFAEALVNALDTPFSVTSIQTGLALNTAVWFDLQLETSTTNTGRPINVDCTAAEQ